MIVIKQSDISLHIDIHIPIDMLSCSALPSEKVLGKECDSRSPDLTSKSILATIPAKCSRDIAK